MAFSLRVRTWSGGWSGPLAVSVLISILAGCDAGPALTPVRGKVLYNGQPLRFGVVMFHPQQGQVAQAELKPDGTFDLSTYELNDGIVPGNYKVSVLCAEAHDPSRSQSETSEAGMTLGKSLIPLKYTRASSSGLTATVSASDTEEIVIEL